MYLEVYIIHLCLYNLFKIRFFLGFGGKMNNESITCDVKYILKKVNFFLVFQTLYVLHSWWHLLRPKAEGCIQLYN